MDAFMINSQSVLKSNALCNESVNAVSELFIPVFWKTVIIKPYKWILF